LWAILAGDELLSLDKNALEHVDILLKLTVTEKARGGAALIPRGRGEAIEATKGTA